MDHTGRIVFRRTFDLDFSQTPGAKVKWVLLILSDGSQSKCAYMNFVLDYEDDMEWIHAAVLRLC